MSRLPFHCQRCLQPALYIFRHISTAIALDGRNMILKLLQFIGELECRWCDAVILVRDHADLNDEPRILDVNLSGDAFDRGTDIVDVRLHAPGAVDEETDLDRPGRWRRSGHG